MPRFDVPHRGGAPSYFCLPSSLPHSPHAARPAAPPGSCRRAAMPAAPTVSPAGRGARNALQFLIDRCHARLPWVRCAAAVLSSMPRCRALSLSGALIGRGCRLPRLLVQLPVPAALRSSGAQGGTTQLERGAAAGGGGTAACLSLMQPVGSACGPGHRIRPWHILGCGRRRRRRAAAADPRHVSAAAHAVRGCRRGHPPPSSHWTSCRSLHGRGALAVRCRRTSRWAGA